MKTPNRKNLENREDDSHVEWYDDPSTCLFVWLYAHAFLFGVIVTLVFKGLKA